MRFEANQPGLARFSRRLSILPWAIAMGFRPTGVALNGNGSRAYVAGNSAGNGMVATIDTATNLVVATVATGLEPWITRAPVHIVVAMREGDYHDRYTEPDKLKLTGQEVEWRVPWWWVDAGKAVMLLLLAAVDEGLGAGLFGLVGDENDRLRELLGIPGDCEIVGVVTVGHPAPEPLRERTKAAIRRRRRPLEEVVRWERW